MNQHGLVDDQESVVELVRGLDRKRVAVLGVEGGDIGGMQKVLPQILDHQYRNALPLLRDERQNGVVKVPIWHLEHSSDVR